MKTKLTRWGMLLAVALGFFLMFVAHDTWFLELPVWQRGPRALLYGFAHGITDQKPRWVVQVRGSLEPHLARQTLGYLAHEEQFRPTAYYDSRVARPLALSRLVAWHYNNKTQLGCVALFRDLADFSKSNPAEYLVARYCEPMPNTMRVPADAEKLTKLIVQSHIYDLSTSAGLHGYMPSDEANIARLTAITEAVLRNISSVGHVAFLVGLALAVAALAILLKIACELAALMSRIKKGSQLSFGTLSALCKGLTKEELEAHVQEIKRKHAQQELAEKEREERRERTARRIDQDSKAAERLAAALLERARKLGVENAVIEALTFSDAAYAQKIIANQEEERRLKDELSGLESRALCIAPLYAHKVNEKLAAAKAALGVHNKRKANYELTCSLEEAEEKMRLGHRRSLDSLN